MVDLVLERKPPFSPEDVVKEFFKTLQLYRVGTVTGDRYTGEWPREQFPKNGIAYEVAHRGQSDLYRDFLPFLTSGNVELLDNDKLKSQFRTWSGEWPGADGTRSIIPQEPMTM